MKINDNFEIFKIPEQNKDLRPQTIILQALIMLRVTQ